MINLTDVQTDLAYLLGEQSAPSTSASDYTVRSTFIQRALERAYRAYDFPMNKLTATVAMVSGVATLPSGLMQDSTLDIRQIVSGSNSDYIYKPIDYSEQDSYSTGSYVYWIEKSGSTDVLKTTETTSATLTARYTTIAPTLNASVSSPFPSSMTIARGALIYYRQSEDPQADIAQEEGLFQGELSEVIAQYNRSRAPRRMIERSRDNNTYIGDTGYL